MKKEKKERELWKKGQNGSVLPINAGKTVLHPKFYISEFFFFNKSISFKEKGNRGKQYSQTSLLFSRNPSPKPPRIKPLKSSQVMPIQTLLLTANLNKFRHNTIQNPTFVLNFSAHPNMGAKPKTINHHETLKQINANPTLNPIFAYDKPSKMTYRFRWFRRHNHRKFSRTSGEERPRRGGGRAMCRHDGCRR